MKGMTSKILLVVCFCLFLFQGVCLAAEGSSSTGIMPACFAMNYSDDSEWATFSGNDVHTLRMIGCEFSPCTGGSGYQIDGGAIIQANWSIHDGKVIIDGTVVGLLSADCNVMQIPNGDRVLILFRRFIYD